MGKDITIKGDYAGYVFLGWAEGQFDADTNTGNGTEKRPYYNMYVMSPVSTYVSDDYCASGYKADKKRCVSSDIWKGLNPGDRIKLFFDDKKRVVLAALDQ